MERAGIVVIWMEVGYQSKVNRLLCWDSEYRSFGFSHDWSQPAHILKEVYYEPRVSDLHFDSRPRKSLDLHSDTFDVEADIKFD